MHKIILASKSPRRKELLELMGLEFAIMSKSIPEIIADDNPPLGVSQLALEKAQAVVNELEEGLVIGADTIVLLENKILGKPESSLQAKEMLSQLSGKEHQVITGVAVIDVKSQKQVAVWEETKVLFRQLTEETIDNYIGTGEPFDKAGAYGIQGKGGLLVSSINGCFFNVVGLPITRLAGILEQDFGLKIL
ncbi:MAG: Maf family protein [Bacillota bacterium]|nr:Maf family protein [Bacillota bacterium]